MGKKKKKVWHCMSSKYTDHATDLKHIDAWLTESEDEEGKTIATINVMNKKVKYLDKRAKTDKAAQKYIKGILEELRF